MQPLNRESLRAVITEIDAPELLHVLETISEHHLLHMIHDAVSSNLYAEPGVEIPENTIDLLNTPHFVAARITRQDDSDPYWRIQMQAQDEVLTVLAALAANEQNS